MKTTRVLAGVALGAALLCSSAQLASAQPPQHCVLGTDGAGCSGGPHGGGGPTIGALKDLPDTPIDANNWYANTEKLNGIDFSNSDLNFMEGYYVSDLHYTMAFCSRDKTAGAVAHCLINR